jgi:hypothetical protein
MAHGKGRGARDTLYGRRGGGWVPQGHDPLAPKAAPAAPKPPTKSEIDEEARKTRQRAEVAAFERAHDLVPGTASHRGDGPGGGPTGGVTWEGLARMAHARRAAGSPLTELDEQALERHPTRPPMFTEEAHA